MIVVVVAFGRVVEVVLVVVVVDVVVVVEVVVELVVVVSPGSVVVVCPGRVVPASTAPLVDVDAATVVVAATEVVVGAWVEVVAPAGQLPTLTAMAYSGSVTSITTDRSSVASVILPTKPAPFVTVIPTRMPLDLPRFNSKVWEKFDGD